MEYRVTWIIDIDAESYEDAARIARVIQLDPESLATHFIIRNGQGEEREVWSNQKNQDEQKPNEQKGESRHDH